jgi:hypothetical protein
MIWQDYRLDGTVVKTNETMMLWQTEKGIVEIGKDTLAVPIKQNSQEKGYVFHGHGKLLIDAIIETEHGAVGKPVEKELDQPFLMLEDTERLQKRLTEAREQDLKRMSYQNPQEFIAKAENLFDQFFRTRDQHRQGFSGSHDTIFAFPNKNNKLDILVVRDARLVYEALDMVYVSDENKAILKSPNEIVCSSNGRSVVIKRQGLRGCCDRRYDDFSLWPSPY